MAPTIPHVSHDLTTRDYTVGGPEATVAIERGLVGADWYRPAVDRAELQKLLRRDDTRATADTIAWFVLLAASAGVVIATWWSWWSPGALLVYGTLYGSTSDARWHECGHRTAFATRWKNDVVHAIASFMVMREPVSWRWSHTRHHAETIVVGRDPEIAYPRPVRFGRAFADAFGLVSGPAEFRKMAALAVGRVPVPVADYVPARHLSSARRHAIVHLALWATVVALSIGTSSLLPIALIGGPSFYGRWLLVVFGTTQHAGLEEDVPDHRRTTRSVRMNPVLRFLYLNMNHHLEHHMFPGVPYRNLPQLADLLAADVPAPAPGLLSAYRKIIPELWRLRR
jgi:fatty acid desaturase